MKNILGEYYSFFKQMTWKYDLHLNWINFYRNDRQPFMANRIKPEAFCYLSLQTTFWWSYFWEGSFVEEISLSTLQEIYSWAENKNTMEHFAPRIAILQFNRNYYIVDNKII